MPLGAKCERTLTYFIAISCIFGGLCVMVCHTNKQLLPAWLVSLMTICVVFLLTAGARTDRHIHTGKELLLKL